MFFKSSSKKVEATIKKEITKQRKPIKKILSKIKHVKRIVKLKDDWVKTGVNGLDALFNKGIPRGTSMLIAGGPGSGKTILCLQILNNAAARGENGLYISLEESEDRLKKHMEDFNWDVKSLEKKGLLKIRRIDPFLISRNVEALLAKAKGELRMKLEVSELIPRGFKPKWIFIDSLTALSAAFRENSDTYRVYIEQLFRYLEKIGVTSFLISETEQIPTKYSPSGVEEFLADGVLVLYNIRKGPIRESAIEILKLRGGAHQKKIVAMEIADKKGIVIYPEQEIIGGLENES